MTALPYRLCAIDLDDTLLGPTQELSERNERAVRGIMAKGVTIVLASGRMHEAALPFAEKLELDTPIISYNGAMVKTPLTRSEWLHEWVSGEHAALIMDYCEKNELQLNYYRDNTIYTAAYTPWLQLYHKRTKAPVQVHPYFYSILRGQPSTKLVIVDSPERTNALLPLFKEMFGDALYITKTNDEYLEFMPPNANKGAALAVVAERFGIPQAETLAFGDGPNDIPLLKWVGLGIAVANAKPALLEIAQRVSPRSEEDGVAQVLEELYGLSAGY